MTSDFVHLHVHTEYSLLDGQSQIDRLIARAKTLEMPAIGISDHGVMFGVMDFYNEAVANNIKPVIGMEAYLAPRGRADRDPQLDKRPYHLLLWAKNQVGYKNLLKIASISQLEGYYYRPRVDREYLAAHSEGIIATSGCLAAEIPRISEEQGDDAARKLIGWYQEVFGAENFFLELQPHNIDELYRLNKWLVEYRQSGHTPVQLLATNDVHYVNVEDTDSHDTLLCIQTSAIKSQPNRMKLEPLGSYYLKSAQEMRREFSGVPDALIDEAFANSLRIAEMTDLKLGKERYHLPLFPVPDGFTETKYLHFLCQMGLSWRYPGRENEPVLMERLERELRIIGDMGFLTYFLIVWDLCEFARSADIWWNVRGSGAGSMVAYCLGITNLDPIQNSLLFERFLNPGRVSMPDIDLDYPDDRRGEMIAYTVEKYGEDKVAAIITFGTMGAKAAVRDVARAMDVPLAKVTAAVKLIPQEAKQKPLREYIDADPDLKKMYQNDTEIRAVMDTAIALQGMTRHASMHAAGVIICDEPLDEIVPLHRITGNTDSSGGVLKAVTQFPMETAEKIGLLKVDFLGLSTLTILRKACELIEQHHGIHYTMDNIPYRHDDDHITDEQRALLTAAFRMLGRGDTVGVFQVESSGMQSMLRDMRPTKFEHIIAGISLYRPGPMDFIPQYNKRLHGDEETIYHHPLLAPILAETYGIMVYQEQIMQIAGDLFSYELGEADLMRRAVSKKKEKDLLIHRETFRERAALKDISQQATDRIFDDIVFFANYGFNKSHASDYAVITVQTAYLKCHYPQEYMTALLCVQFDDSTKVGTFLEECRRLQIPVLPPDVNYSQVDFAIEQMPDGRRGIRFGLGAIKNAGVNALQFLVNQRESGGTFTTLADFADRVDMRVVGRKALECLIKVGALEQFGERDAMLESLERIVQFSIDAHRTREVGQFSLFEATSADFDALTIPKAKAPIARRLQLGWERELLGLYVTGRPVDKFKDQLAHLTNLSQVAVLKNADTPAASDKGVVIAGEVVSIRKVITGKGETMGIIQVEDWHESAGVIEAVLFPRTWFKVAERFRLELERPFDVGEIILVRGRFDTARGEPQIVVDDIDTNFQAFMPDETTAVTLADEPLPGWMDGNGAGSYRNPDDDMPVVVQPVTVPQMSSNEAIPWESSAVMTDLSPLFDDETATRETYKIVVHIVSQDDDRDRQRMRKVFGLFHSFGGDDNFEVIVHFPHKRQRWASAAYRTGYSEELCQKLGAISGVRYEVSAAS